MLHSVLQVSEKLVGFVTTVEVSNVLTPGSESVRENANCTFCVLESEVSLWRVPVAVSVARLYEEEVCRPDCFFGWLDDTENTFCLLLKLKTESHTFRNCGERMPWKRKISTPCDPTKMLKRTWNTKVTSFTSELVAVSPIPQPRPNNIESPVAMIRFCLMFFTAVLLFSSYLKLAVLRWSSWTMMIVNMTQLNA